MPKRYRPRPFKPGVLEIYWGVVEGESKPSIVYQRGDGCVKPDWHLLCHVFGCKRVRFDWEKGHNVHDPSLLEELEARGYDLTTLKFSIKRRQDIQRST